MPSSMNWADGSAGGTPLTAANLNKLMVTADVATAGTPTGDALKVYGRRQALAYGDPSLQSNGTPAALTSGQALADFGSAPITVSSGLYAHTPPAATNTAGYLQADLGSRVGRIGANVQYASGATGAIAFVLPLTSWSGGTFGEAGVHFVMYRDVWHISHWNGTGEDIYTSGTHAALLDDGLPHRVEIALDGSTAYITFPDGSTVKVTDSRINSAVSTLAIWELYEGNGATDPPAKFAGIWADTVPALGSGSATPLDVAVSRSLIPVAATSSIQAPASAATVAVTTSEAEVMRTTITVPTNFKKWLRLSAYVSVTTSAQVYFAVRATTVGAGGGQFEWQQLIVDNTVTKGTFGAERLVDLTSSGFAAGNKVDLVWTVWGSAAGAASIVSDATRAATMHVSSM